MQDDETQAKLQAALAASGDNFQEGWKAGKKYMFDIAFRDMHRLLACVRGIGVDILHVDPTSEDLRRAAEGAMRVHDELIEKWKDR